MNDNEILKKVQNTFAKHGYSKLSFEKINFGLNSSSWKIISLNKRFFLKYYKSENNDYRDRLGNEYRFIEFLREGKIQNVPRIFLTNRKENWTVFEWLEGEKINNPTVQDFEEMVLFLKDLQNLKDSKKIETIRNASEACFNLIEHKELILKRIEQMIKLCGGSFQEWLINEVLLSVNICTKEYYYYFANSRDSFIEKKERILSPSDIGFHNILKLNNKLYFYDFEYAGWDDPYKLAVDMIIQPENILNKKSSLKLLNSLKTIFPKNYKFEYLKIYLILYRAKWVCIISKRIIKNPNLKKKEQELIIKKTIDYFNLVGKIWSL